MRTLFFGMGNICRSPVVADVARARFAHAGLAVEIDSAGTENYHIGEQADARAIASARQAGYDISAHRARQLGPADFEAFDLLLAMDRVNLRAARARGRAEYSEKLGLFLPRAGVVAESEVPDPYYGDDADFRRVIDLAELGADALIATLRKGA